MVCLLADGHLLLEDRPGLGKTRFARAFAEAFGGTYRRVQGTPDLLPSDITGSLILDRSADAANTNGRSDGFRIRYGPVFSHVLLFDEVNRTPPRTQSALLEAMEERQATIFDETPRLPDPFFVIATQNPIDMDGTYSLPEAQLDRFLMRLELGYPDTDAFRAILDRIGADRPVPVQRTAQTAATGIDPAGLLEMIDHARTVPVTTEVRDYLAAIVEATRDQQRVLLGASPRAGLALLRAARVYAAARGAGSVHPDHVQALAGPVLAHRIVLADAPVVGVTRAQLDYVAEVVASVPTPKHRHDA
ncbi:ATPase [Virgisporangium aurantiacum]|uniref:ATPase n=1 Tax=Virgisporangium aurantiacum TaxID=175570 RepID=A0A8J4E7F2_9ACTN|nr:ATPase [Virgisporangium aurantiacum]